MRRSTTGFTLIELLVVIAIISLLMSIVMPSLSNAQALAKAVRCRANLHSIGLGMAAYEGGNDGLVIPSYNMHGSARGADNPLDGWCAILDRDGVMPATAQGSDTAFWCPDTKEQFGMSGGTIEAEGFQYWPVSSQDQTLQAGLTIPQYGFNKIIRCSYWINGNNPIGTLKATAENEKFYTGSVGYRAADGTTIKPTRNTSFRRPGCLVAATDGVYAGQQSATRIGEDKRRIGYRHRGPSTNAVFADGHAAPIRNDDFPRGNVYAENSGNLTLYADVDRWLSH